MKHHFPLLALLSFIFTGCPTYTADCPVYEDLNQDQDVTIYDLKQLTEDWAAEAIVCEDLCASIEYQISGFDTEIDDCSLELDIQAYHENQTCRNPDMTQNWHSKKLALRNVWKLTS